MGSSHYDVAVVGLGPVGSVAALLLAQDGLTVFAADAASTPYDKPRAIGLDQDSLRILQGIGIADDLAPGLGAYRQSEYRSGSGELLRRIVPPPEPYPLAWPPYSTFIQPDLERLMRRKLASQERLTVALGANCFVIGQEDDCAILSFDRGDERFDVTAKFVVACDGASSFVRESMGLELEDLEFDEPWLVVDVLVNNQAELPESIVQYCDPARPCTFVPGPGALRRWEIMLLPGEDPASMVDDAMVWRLLSRWLTPDQGQLWRTATYRFHALVARQWRSGRIFLAGDAAHQTPPFMAQGLNLGFRDVANLSWKLTEVAARDANPSILDSYERERRPNAKAVITVAKDLGRLICERDLVVAAARDERMKAEVQSCRDDIVRQSLLPPLDDGMLMRDPSGALMPGAGQVFPQAWVEDEGKFRRMDDVVGARFLMIMLPGTAIGDELTAKLAPLGVTLVTTGDQTPIGRAIPIRERDRVIQSWMEEFQVCVALVRPDHIVFGTSRSRNGATDLLCALEAQLTNRAIDSADVYRTD